MDEADIVRLAAAFPFLRDLDPEAARLLTSRGSIATFPAGQVLARPGEECRQAAFVLSGEARAHSRSETGRDLTLYRIFPGQTCVLTAMCIVGHQPFPAIVDVEEEVTALAVPVGVYRRLFETSEPWRTFIFRTLTERVSELFGLIDSVVFADLPARLADALLTQQQSGVVRLTHEQLAGEVGTAREVVSRTLKAWERQGLVSLSRGRVDVVSSQALAQIALR